MRMHDPAHRPMLSCLDLPAFVAHCDCCATGDATAPTISLGELMALTFDVPHVAEEISGGDLRIKPEEMLPSAPLGVRGKTAAMSIEEERP